MPSVVERLVAPFVADGTTFGFDESMLIGVILSL